MEVSWMPLLMMGSPDSGGAGQAPSRKIWLKRLALDFAYRRDRKLWRSSAVFA